MSQRTEEEILASAPLKVILGGEEYEIPILVIKHSREWRKKIIALIAPLPSLVKGAVDVENPEGFGDILTNMMVTMPDQVLDLFFEYAKDLNRDEIEGKATDAEIANAFEKVVAVVFPLAESLPGAMKRLSPSEEPSSSSS